MLVVTTARYTIEYEIKTSVSDFRADFKKSKHDRLAGKCPGRWRPTRFFFAFPENLIDAVTPNVPAYAGIIAFRTLGTWHIPRETVVRKAPRLEKNKAREQLVIAMRETAYYRFWNERERFDAYRRQAKQAKDAGVQYAAP